MATIQVCIDEESKINENGLSVKDENMILMYVFV